MWKKPRGHVNDTVSIRDERTSLHDPAAPATHTVATQPAGPVSMLFAALE